MKGQADIIKASAKLLEKGLRGFHVSYVGKESKQKEYGQLVK